MLDRGAALLDRLAKPPLPVGRAQKRGPPMGWPASARPESPGAVGEDLNPLSTPPRPFRSTASPAGSIA
jgi:hypothetical protein